MTKARTSNIIGAGLCIKREETRKRGQSLAFFCIFYIKKQLFKKILADFHTLIAHNFRHVVTHFFTFSLHTLSSHSCFLGYF